MWTCQNLLLKSIVEKCLAPTILSSTSRILGNRYESFFLHASTQKWRDPSFLCTSTTVLHHGDWLGQMAPTSSMSLRDVSQALAMSHHLEQLAPPGTILQGERAMQTLCILLSCPSSNKWGCLTCCIPQQIPCHFPS